EQVRQSLQFAIWRLESQFTWNNDTVSQTLMDLANQMGIKLRDFMPTFFIAIAGSTSSTPVMQSMVTLGPDLTFARLRHALEIVGAPSKKEVKNWEKLNESLKLPKNEATSEA
ncbi:glutamate--tRNA ligase, partial [Acinetobacter baumannii]